MRWLICNEFLSLNAFGFVFYHDTRRYFLRLRRRRLAFDLVFLAFDLVLLAFILLVFLAFDLVFLAPPLGLESNICIILIDFG